MKSLYWMSLSGEPVAEKSLIELGNHLDLNVFCKTIVSYICYQEMAKRKKSIKNI